MEGYELYALQSGTTILDSVLAIYTEVNFKKTRHTCGLYEDLRKFLETKGFLEVEKESFGKFGNALFIRN
jgi:hypothetical protein